MSIDYQIITKLSQAYCSYCGFLWAVPAGTYEIWVTEHTTHYCPSCGKSQKYGKGRVEKLQEELERTNRYLENARHYLEQERKENKSLKNSIKTTKGHITRIKNRVGNGVCPCCNRTFKQLAEHMKDKHPEFKKEK